MGDHLAREMRRQRPTYRMAALARFGGIGRDQIDRGSAFGASLGLVGLEFADQ